jgi:hypothetical protein
MGLSTVVPLREPWNGSRRSSTLHTIAYFFLLVSLTVVLGCVLAYFSVTNLPVFAERLSVVVLPPESFEELPFDAAIGVPPSQG